MYLRSLLQRSPFVRIALLLLVAVFFGVCGLHLAAAHHDGGNDGLALGEILGLLVLASVIIVGLQRTGVTRTDISSATSVSLFGGLGDLDPSGTINRLLPLLI